MEYCDGCKKIRAVERQEEIREMLARYGAKKIKFRQELNALETERNYMLDKLRKSRDELL